MRNVGFLFRYSMLNLNEYAHGRQQAGRRPALMVQTNASKANSLPTIMIVPLTTNLDWLHLPYTFLIPPSTSKGLTGPSVALVFQLRAIDRQRVDGRRVGTLEQNYLDQLDTELRKLLAF